MCGIGGFAGEFDRDVLDRLGNAMIHRGPDDGGVVVAENGGSRVGLVNRRLAILDLSAAGHQPMDVRCPLCAPVDAPAHERLWVTFNGEIYNFPELRRQLEQSGHRFRSHTDTEVLLHLYASEGPEMLRRLNGMFALAIYDGRPGGQRAEMRRGDLLLARDGLGIKPLYYTESPAGVVFASELKALLQCGAGIDGRLDPVAVSQYLAYQWVPAPRTVLADIRKVLPGQFLVIRGGRITASRTFYHLPLPAADAAPPLPELVGQFRATLRAAVNRQLQADVPVGAFLSGGLDSSAVVAMVRQARPGYRLPCYTMAFRDDFASEGAPADLPYARLAARHLGVELVTVDAGADMVDRLDEVLYALDEPTGDPAPINAFLIAERAHRDGLKVLLSGAGGDDLLGGYGRHRWLALEQVWDALPPTLASAAAAWAQQSIGGGLQPGTFAGRRLLRLVAQLDQPRDRRLAERLQTTPAALRARLLHETIRAELPDDSDLEPLLDTIAALPRGVDPLAVMLRLEQRHFLGDHNVNYLDKTTMAVSVESRVPLLDMEMVALAAAIPSRYKVSGLETKYVFKKAMEPYLPPQVIYRPKSGFGVPLRRWMARDLSGRVRDTLSPAALRRRDVFDAAAVQQLIDDTQAGRVDGAYPLFSIFAFETWCRRLLDSRDPGSGSRDPKNPESDRIPDPGSRIPVSSQV